MTELVIEIYLLKICRPSPMGIWVATCIAHQVANGTEL